MEDSICRNCGEWDNNCICEWSNKDWKCKICGEEINEDELCKCMREHVAMQTKPKTK